MNTMKAFDPRTRGGQSEASERDVLQTDPEEDSLNRGRE